MMMNGPRIIAQSPVSVQQRARHIGSGTRPAQRWPPFRTGEAVATARHENHHNMIANLEVGHTLAQYLHDAGRFMAQRHG